MRRQEARVLREALVRKLERGQAELDITAATSFATSPYQRRESRDSQKQKTRHANEHHPTRQPVSSRRKQALQRVAQRKRQQQQQQQQQRRRGSSTVVAHSRDNRPRSPSQQLCQSKTSRRAKIDGNGKRQEGGGDGARRQEPSSTRPTPQRRSRH